MQDTYDPFSYLLNEIRAHDAGLREHWDPYQRDHCFEVLLIEVSLTAGRWPDLSGHRPEPRDSGRERVRSDGSG